MDVLQCPICELRFTSRSELEQHKAFDHPGIDTDEKEGSGGSEGS
ncbi:MAG: hypothetical protein ACR2KQ_06310 [Actinomycetota bacterium]